MSTIIAASFPVITESEEAIRRLQEAGVHLDQICTFRVNPAGEHDRTAIGGDHANSLGAKHAHAGAGKGAAIGAAAGVAAGAAITPFLGPAGIAAGAAVGAYTGSLVGSVKEMEHEGTPDHGDVRPASSMVAINLDAAGCTEEMVVRVLEECGALMIEQAQGTWTDGYWADFDPISRPHVIGGLEFARRADIDRPENRPVA